MAKSTRTCLLIPCNVFVEEERFSVEEQDDEDEQEKGGEDEEGEESKPAMTEEERREKAMLISSQKILTQKDFEQLKIIQMKKKIQDRRKNRYEESISNTKKRKFISIDTDSDEDEDNNKSQNKFDILFPLSTTNKIFFFLVRI